MGSDETGCHLACGDGITDWEAFCQSVLAFGREHGRSHLPWQCPQTPYRVWVSEIMLQQTQVQTVIPYFDRFMARFPDVRALAHANVHDVMAHWSGLGYYARGRRLHEAAKKLVVMGHDDVPQDMALLMALPGIGRSTAGAVMSLGFNQPYSVLDGNVRRVFLRYLGWDAPLNGALWRRLWSVCESALSRDAPRLFNQTMMDLGAMVCTKRSPDCKMCPLADACVARAKGLTAVIPRSAVRRVQKVHLVWHVGVRQDAASIF